MILEDLQEYIKGAGFGVDYIYDVPVKTENVMWLVSSPSPPPNPSLGYYEQMVDVWGRYQKTSEGKDAILGVFELLHRKVAYTVGGHYVYLSVAGGMIDDMGKDAEGRRLLRLPIKIIYRESNNDTS